MAHTSDRITTTISAATSRASPARRAPYSSAADGWSMAEGPARTSNLSDAPVRIAWISSRAWCTTRACRMEKHANRPTLVGYRCVVRRGSAWRPCGAVGRVCRAERWRQCSAASPALRGMAAPRAGMPGAAAVGRRRCAGCQSRYSLPRCWRGAGRRLCASRRRRPPGGRGRHLEPHDQRHGAARASARRRCGRHCATLERTCNTRQAVSSARVVRVAQATWSWCGAAVRGLRPRARVRATPPTRRPVALLRC